MSSISGIVDNLTHLPAGLAYTVIALLVFAEAAIFVGFVLPGETAVLIGGVLASTGKLSLAVLLPLVVIAAVTGDSVGYEVGRAFGPRLLRSRLLASRAERITTAQETLRRRGGWAILLARTSAFLRAVVPALAGVSRRPYRTFLPWNAAGGLIWGVGVALLGYSAGSSYKVVERTLGRVSYVLVAVIVVGFVALRLRRRRRKHVG